MNERIKEMLDQCTLANKPWPLVDTDKFAELIVKECIGLVQPSDNHRAWAQGYVAGVEGVELLDFRVAHIKRHFGVEQ